MERKDRIDLFGALALSGFSLFLAFNQIVIKWVNAGLQPVFFAGLRSAIAWAVLWLWMTRAGRRPQLSRAMALPGLGIGLAFSVEFIFLFLALDLTTVTRTAILLNSMPVWMTIGAHLFLPGERITPVKALGLVSAYAGVALALSQRTDTGQAALAGDLCALGAAICWAAIALVARGTRLRALAPEMQLYWQVTVSVPVLLIAAPFFGPLIREFAPVHILGVAFQGVVVVALGFVFWLRLLAIYPAAGVASFAFLSPVFGVTLGWLLLSEPVGLRLAMAAALVAAGIVLINRPAKA